MVGSGRARRQEAQLGESLSAVKRSLRQSLFLFLSLCVSQCLCEMRESHHTAYQLLMLAVLISMLQFCALAVLEGKWEGRGTAS